MKRALKEFLRAARRIAVIVAGSAVLLVGLALTVLPGPAFIVIPLGISILATEVPVARRVLRKAKIWLTKQRRHHLPAAKRLWLKLKNAFAPRPRPRRARHPRPSGNP